MTISLSAWVRIKRTALAVALAPVFLFSTNAWSQADIDTDGDGMPDAWENTYGLNPNDPNDDLLDSDGDGWLNIQEYGAGTNPQNPASKPGKTVAYFTNSTYTDPNEELPKMRNTISAAGFSAKNFTGFSAMELEAALIGVNIIVIPELSNAANFGQDWYAALTQPARKVLRDFVYNGGGIYITGQSGDNPGNELKLMNGLFGYAVNRADTTTSTTRRSRRNDA